MAEQRPIKDLINPAAVARIEVLLGAVAPDFDGEKFRYNALNGLGALEMKARVAQLAAALKAALPQPPAEVIPLLVAALERVLAEAGTTSEIAFWPFLHYIEVYGVDVPQVSLPALRSMTRFFSAEFAVRPYLQRYPEQAFLFLAECARDEDPRVRRLASEGSRPRLPWGQRLQALVNDPSPCLPLLDVLCQDADESVRRSVANHLNDISKDHPELAVDVGRRWLVQSDQREIRQVVKHALRSLVKQGHEGALALLGFEPPEGISVALDITPSVLQFGGSLQLEARLHSRALHDQSLIVDYIVHHQKKDGTLSPKVFKWTVMALAAGKDHTLRKQHTIRPVTTRVFYDGAHRVEVQVNGAVLASQDFMLEGVGR